MKTWQLSFVAAVAAVGISAGCSTTGKPSPAPLVSMQGDADAVVYVSGLSCPF